MVLDKADLAAILFCLLVVAFAIVPAIDSLLDRRHRARVEREYARKTGVKGLPKDRRHDV